VNDTTVYDVTVRPGRGIELRGTVVSLQLVGALVRVLEPLDCMVVVSVRERRRITPELLRQVADVYLANPATPTKAVHERFFVSMRQATNYVQAAEAAGYLPPTTRGKKRTKL
jgi:hypothetical protein